MAFLSPRCNGAKQVPVLKPRCTASPLLSSTRLGGWRAAPDIRQAQLSCLSWTGSPIQHRASMEIGDATGPRSQDPDRCLPARRSCKKSNFNFNPRRRGRLVRRQWSHGPTSLHPSGYEAAAGMVAAARQDRHGAAPARLAHPELKTVVDSVNNRKSAKLKNAGVSLDGDMKTREESTTRILAASLAIFVLQFRVRLFRSKRKSSSKTQGLLMNGTQTHRGRKHIIGHPIQSVVDSTSFTLLNKTPQRYVKLHASESLRAWTDASIGFRPATF